MSEFGLAETYSQGDSIVALIGGENKRLDVKHINIFQEKTFLFPISIEEIKGLTPASRYETALLESHTAILNGIFKQVTEQGVSVNFGTGLQTGLTLETIAFNGISNLALQGAHPNHFENLTYDLRVYKNSSNVVVFALARLTSSTGHYYYRWSSFNSTEKHLVTYFDPTIDSLPDWEKFTIETDGTVTNIS